MLRTLLSNSLHDASFLWLFLSRQPPIIEFNKFKDLKTFEHYGIRKPKFELHDEKYVQGAQKCVRFRWFYELCQFELKEFSCKGLLVDSEGTKELVRFR